MAIRNIRGKCQWCGMKLLVSLQTKRARCTFCQRIIEFQHNTNGYFYLGVNGNSYGTSTNIYDDTCIPAYSSQESESEVSFGISKWPTTSQGNQDNISSTSSSSCTERKGLRVLCQKISDTIYPNSSCPRPRSSPSFIQCVTARISDTPPRGKRALLCGVSYGKKRKFKNQGAIQDVTSMAKLLIEKFSFPTNGILVLAEYMSYEPPTRNNILRALEWLVKDIQSGDSLVFYFSGHGLRQPEFEGDEIDGFDEAIFPLDFETAGPIIDNDINELIVRPLNEDIMLHAIIDACHSGTALDLPYVYDTDRSRWKDYYSPSDAYKGTNGGKAICFSAWEDHQEVAYTSVFSSEKITSGVITYTFIRAIMENQEITYRDILKSMQNAVEDAKNCQLNRAIHRKILQVPLLSSSQVFDVNEVLKL
ncbi:hypothetical protein ACH5RR_002023 [Cinchona calisaya]|uniref:Peptidase C14 caspase domain-containing protein n=1 Tax=Cinchona calisaya TaxID=153742 RepID=A0ABD3B523_9GENT